MTVFPETTMTNKVCVSAVTLMVLALCIGISGRAQATASANSQQARSRRIHEILQEAQSYQAANAKTGATLQEIIRRKTATFVEFQKQCLDLKATFAENDAMEKRKRKMLAELRFEFQDDSKVRPLFILLGQMEDVSDNVDPIWRGMIACSDILASSDESKRDAYQTICVDPAHQQLQLLIPKIDRLARQLQTELQKNGDSLPSEFLQVIGQ